MLDENFITEAVKPGIFDVLNRYPDFILENTLGQLPDDLDNYKLAEGSNFDLLVIPEIEKEGALFRVRVEIKDVRRMATLMLYTRDCGCPFEDVVFMMMPEAADKLSKAKFELDTLCPVNMVALQQNTFTMGSDSKYDNNPIVQAHVSSFCIDQYEYPSAIGKDPIVGLTWNEADSSCRSAGKRLCTEFEWENACRGKFNWTYPYGNQYSEKICNTESKELKVTGALINCKTEGNIFDMSGNVNEWTGSNWDANIRNKVIRGGAFFSGENDSRCTLRFSNRPATKAKAIGFRCCKSIN